MEPNDHDPAEIVTVLRVCHACGKRLLAKRSREAYAEFGRKIGDALLCAVCASDPEAIEAFVEVPEEVSSKGVILLAEDDKCMQEMLNSFLVTEGYTVCCVDDGYTFMAEALVGTYDLIISDICMPNGYGDEVLPIIRKRGVTTPVIFITGFAQKSLILDTTLLFEKPLDLGELLHAVEQKIEPKALGVAASESLMKR